MDAIRVRHLESVTRSVTLRRLNLGIQYDRAATVGGAVKGDPPTHCPHCGARVDVVRHIMALMFELACESCDRTAVVMSDDFVKLREVHS